jgi:hypothetical protein
VQNWSNPNEWDLPGAHSAAVLSLFQLDFHADHVHGGMLFDRISPSPTSRSSPQSPPTHNQRQAKTAVKTIRTYLMDVVYSVWHQHNNTLHDNDTMIQLLSYKHTQLAVPQYTGPL